MPVHSGWTAFLEFRFSCRGMGKGTASFRHRHRDPAPREPGKLLTFRNVLRLLLLRHGLRRFVACPEGFASPRAGWTIPVEPRAGGQGLGIYPHAVTFRFQALKCRLWQVSVVENRPGPCVQKSQSRKMLGVHG